MLVKCFELLLSTFTYANTENHKKRVITKLPKQFVICKENRRVVRFVRFVAENIAVVLKLVWMAWRIVCFWLLFVRNVSLVVPQFSRFFPCRGMERNPVINDSKKPRISFGGFRESLSIKEPRCISWIGVLNYSFISRPAGSTWMEICYLVGIAVLRKHFLVVHTSTLNT